MKAHLPVLVTQRPLGEHLLLARGGTCGRWRQLECSAKVWGLFSREQEPLKKWVGLKRGCTSPLFPGVRCLLSQCLGGRPL